MAKQKITVTPTMGEGTPPEAVAIAGNRIIRVGSKDDVAGLKASHTRVIDAAQKTVMPGIIEGHVHLFGGAVELETLMLNGMTGFEAVADAVALFRKQRPGEPVLLATGIAHEAFGEPITRQILDRMVSDIPFIMGCFDHHTMWANTKALEMAGIMNGRNLPIGNEIVLDHNGIATGELREPAAYMLVQALTPTGGREWLGMTTGENPNPPATAAQRELGADTLTDKVDTPFSELGLDSLSLVDFMFTVEDHFHVNIEHDRALQNPTLTGLAALDDQMEMVLDLDALADGEALAEAA